MFNVYSLGITARNQFCYATDFFNVKPEFYSVKFIFSNFGQLDLTDADVADYKLLISK